MSNLSGKYDRNWIIENSLSGNVLLSLQALLEKIPITRGMTVLDLGCGKGVTSVYVAREFQARVFAVDKEIDPTTNFLFFLKNQVADVIPLRASAHHLPFPHGFFDVILVTNSYGYFGTDDKFLPYIAQFLKRMAGSAS
jgi:cyclopropane fatty-acyl-phospholipid synthase-like methyltransferase